MKVLHGGVTWIDEKRTENDLIRARGTPAVSSESMKKPTHCTYLIDYWFHQNSFRTSIRVMEWKGSLGQ